MVSPFHRLTCSKGVYQFRYFLPQCIYQIPLLTAHAYMYAFVLKWATMRIPPPIDIHIVAHFSTNAYMHDRARNYKNVPLVRGQVARKSTCPNIFTLVHKHVDKILDYKK